MSMYSLNVGGPSTDYLAEFGGVTAHTHEATVNSKNIEKQTKSQGNSIWGLAYSMSLTHNTSYEMPP